MPFDEKLDKIEAQLEKNTQQLAENTTQLAVYNAQLAIHISGTKANTERIEKLEDRHLKAMGAIIAGLAGVLIKLLLG
jgi:maleate cis-trans isomerase